MSNESGRVGSGKSSSVGFPSNGTADSFDAYDMINAPQFVDFDDLRQGLLDDNDEADQFFNTHREEDDYFVPVENLVPSIQYLNSVDANNDGVSMKPYETISPPVVLKSNSQFCNSPAKTPAISVVKKKSLEPYTEISNGYQLEKHRENYGKENTQPNQIVSNNSVRKILEESQQSSPNESCLRDSLVAQLENMHLNMSDGDNSYKEDVLDKEVASIVPSNSSEVTKEEVRVVAKAKSTTPTLTHSSEEVSDKVNHQYSLDYSKKSSIPELSDMREPGDRPYSIYVAPSIGSEVKWNEDKDEGGIKAGDVSLTTVDDTLDTIADPTDCFFDFECHILSGQALQDSPQKKNLRRASSCSDIAKLVVPVERTVNVYGYLPHVGITVPKTPDKSKKIMTEARVGKYSPSRVRPTTNLVTQGMSRQGPVRIPPPKMGIARKRSESGDTNSASAGGIRQSRPPVKENRFISLAEAVNQFHRGTPDRFHSKSKSCVPPRALSASGDRRDGGRRMPSPSPGRLPSTSKVGKKPFDSANTSIESVQSTDQPDSATKSVKSMPGLIKPNVFSLQKRFEIKATVPKPFKFHETRRRANAGPAEQEEFIFKARPAPMKIFHGTTGLKDKIEVKPTSPKEPHFASDDRIKDRQHKRAVSAHTSPVRNTHARPMTASKIPTPSKGQSGIPRLEPPKSTTIRPFSFEDRDKEMFRRKQEKIHQEIEEKRKIKEFHANPLPDFSKCGLPKKKTIELTDVAPFNLKVDERGAVYQQNWKSKLDSEMQDLKERAKFHANPPSVIYKKPFEPDYHNKPLVEPIEFYLNTDKRAQERERYEQALKQREEQEEAHRREMELEQQQRDREEAIEKRRQMVHKPLPLKLGPGFHVKSSNKPLTEPQSPAFKPLPSQRRMFK